MSDRQTPGLQSAGTVMAIGDPIHSYANPLQRNIAAAYCYFEMPRVAIGCVSFLLAVQTLLLAYSAYVHSPTLNEPGHLVAGLSHWKFGQFDVYRVNPPLVRMIAALPVITAGYSDDWTAFSAAAGVRPEFALGEAFVKANGERSLFLFTIARWACIPFSWIGAITCFLWARDLYGRPAGIVACGLWCFEPNILAHASLMTPDAHAAALGLAAGYTFWLWLKKPTWMQTVVTGVILGLAELAKTTLILFFPLWPLLWLAYRWPNRHELAARDWLREASMLALRMVIAVYVINLGYGFEGSFRRFNEYHFVSELFTGNTITASGRRSSDVPELAFAQPQSVNRFVGTMLGTLPVPLPKNYLLGIDVQQRDFEHYGRPSYLRGTWRDHGWWYYYLYAVTIKVPLGILLLGFLVLAARILRWLPRVEWRDEIILLAPPTIIFVVVSSKTGFSEHMRYVLPTFGFAFVWISQAISALAKENSVRMNSLVVVLLVWSFASGMFVFPHSLSYFNELAGGPEGGFRHLASSNIDWGQDLRYLKWWLEENPDSKPLYLAYFGAVNPADLGVRSSALPKTVQSAADLENLTPGWYAISANFLSGYPWGAYDQSGIRRQIDRGALSDFQLLTPAAHAGQSIVIYHVGEH